LPCICYFHSFCCGSLMLFHDFETIFKKSFPSLREDFLFVFL
jgi:hypothetical protein